MRYLIVCDFALTFVGGAQSALLRQAEALLAQGDAVAVLAPDVAKAKLSAGIRRIEPPEAKTVPGLFMPLYRNHAKHREFASRTIADFKPDAIITHSEFGLVAAFTQAARSLGVRSIHIVHTFMWHAPKTTAPLAPIATWVFKFVTNLKPPRIKLATNPMDSALRNMTLAACLNADVTISPSRHQGEKLERAGVRNLEVLSNVTETSGVATSLPAGNTLRLAWIGRFSPEKRLEVAIDGVELAQKRLAAEGLDPRLIELHIAGGPERSGTPHVWHGILKPDGVADLLRNSHSLVLTSLGFDNQPMVVLEAFSHGRPVILTDPVLGKEFGDAALLTPTPHAEGLADRLVALVKSGNDLAGHAAAATEFAKGTTASVQAERLKELATRA